MAGAPPIDRPFREAIEAAVRASTRGTGSVLDQVSRIPEVIQFAAEESIAGETVVEGSAVAAGTTEAVLGLVDLSSLPFLAAAIAVLIVARRIHDIERDLLGRVPWVGSKLAYYADISFPFIDQVEQWVIDRLVDTVSTLGSGISALVWWTLTGHGGGVPNPNAALIDARLEPLHSQISHLTEQVNLLTNELSPLAIGSPLTAGGDVQGSAALNARLDQIEQRNSAQGQEISQLNQRMASMESTMRTVTAELEHLRVTLYGVRASGTGLQDLTHEVAQLRSSLEITQGDIEAQLQRQAQDITHLMPLASLLYLGERGIQTLRSLEQRPCQCPQLPRIPSLMPEALALELAVAHGL